MDEPAPAPSSPSRAPLGPVPLRALLISLGALSVPVLGGLYFQETLAEYRALLWSLALVPALLMAFHRGWGKVTLALGGGMVLLSLADLAGRIFDVPVEDWPLFLLVVSAYIGIALGGGWLSEVRKARSELTTKEAELERAYTELSASHERLKSAQLQLIQAEKLESIGLLAAGVAHEVKNPLMTLLTGVEYLRKFPPIEDEAVRELLDDMWLAVKRADSVIKGLLDYSRAKDLYLKDEDLNDLVERTLLMEKHDCSKHHITVVKELAPDLPSVRIDSYKIQQVLLNLFTNSIQAMDDGGTLTVRTGRWVDWGEGEDTQNGDDPLQDDLLLIEVCDTGPGIPEDHMKKVLEPFFSTKPTGKGTGLGLAVAHQIMEMHGGVLEIRNGEVGVRARLTLKPDTEVSQHEQDQDSAR